MQPPLTVLQRYPAHDSTLGGLLASRARHNAMRSVLCYDGREIGYAELARRIEAAARALDRKSVV